jgi:hypothetical protein
MPITRGSLKIAADRMMPVYEERYRAQFEEAMRRDEERQRLNKELQALWKVMHDDAEKTAEYERKSARLAEIIADSHSDDFLAAHRPVQQLRFARGDGREDALACNDDSFRSLSGPCVGGGGHHLHIGRVSSSGESPHWSGVTLECHNCPARATLPTLDASLALLSLARDLGLVKQVNLLPPAVHE